MFTLSFELLLVIFGTPPSIYRVNTKPIQNKQNTTYKTSPYHEIRLIRVYYPGLYVTIEPHFQILANQTLINTPCLTAAIKKNIYFS